MNGVDYSDAMLEHDARLEFDALMRELIARGIDADRALAVVRRVAKDGNGWAA